MNETAHVITRSLTDAMLTAARTHPDYYEGMKLLCFAQAPLPDDVVPENDGGAVLHYRSLGFGDSKRVIRDLSLYLHLIARDLCETVQVVVTHAREQRP